ncbi:MAG: TonB family protein [Steroidobacteraceae bacterium]
MRVLIVDQDSAMLEAIVRALRERYTVDAVTNKGDCLDLLRQNTFEVIVAGERLEDGSGLELLGQVAKRWPSMLRIFAADHHRLQLLKGRLGPFELFQTLSYPVDPDRLLATLTLADAAQNADADMSNIQHVVLGGDTVLEESSAFPPPEPQPRVAPQRPQPSRPKAVRSVARTSQGRRPSPIPTAQGTATSRPALSVAATTGRPRSSSHRRPPVRFPSIDAPQGPPTPAPGTSAVTDSIGATAAREARSNAISFPTDPESTRGAMLMGAGAAIVLGVVFLGFKLFGANHESAVHATAPAVKAPEYPHQVTELVAAIETALKQDDFNSVRDDVEKLRQIAPSHPRLAFFESLLAPKHDASKADAPKGRAANPSHGGQDTHAEAKLTPRMPGHADPSATSDKAAAAAVVSSSAKARNSASKVESTAPEASASPDAATLGIGARPHDAALPPETRAGMSLSPLASVTLPAPTPAPATVQSAAPTPAVSTSGAPASGAPSGSSVPSATPAVSSDEPPPVIREPKLIRHVKANYPSAAKRDGIQGSVDLDVTLSKEGIVQDVSVAHSDPPEVFDKAALAAVRRYKYDPRFVDGLPVEAHLKVHLDFKPGQDER